MEKKVKKSKATTSIKKVEVGKASQDFEWEDTSAEHTGFPEDVDFKKNLGCGG